jgi:bifunctional non-homologous end joining protein LigD
VRLLSRNRKGLNGTYPELVEALAGQAASDYVVDGEIAAFDGPRTSFARLQSRMQLREPRQARASRVPVRLYLFDLLHLDGLDLTELALRDRKRMLREAIVFRPPLRLMVHRNAAGEAAYRDACARGWEGLIAKRADAPYRGGRSTDWLKFTCARQQEFVIGGFTDPGGQRTGFGALLVGYYEDGALRYAGKVGTGYDATVLRDLAARLGRLEQARPPFAGDDLPRRAHWVRPRLVAQIGFTEMTRDGKLRHPRFLGLRDDKRPAEVVLERPVA